MKETKIIRDRLDISYYNKILTDEDIVSVYNTIEKEVRWSKPITKSRRTNQTFGDDGLTYEIDFSYGKKDPSKIVKRKALPWDRLSILPILKERVEEITGSKFNFCVIQRYPNGNVGINPHRDTEMILGTIIVGLSLGSERILTMSPVSFIKEDKVNILLPPGSLFVLNPPTNSYWMHSIGKSKDDTPRISLTFRNVKNLC